MPLLFISCVSKENYDNKMSDDDISWINHYYVGNTIYYESNRGNIDTMVVTELKIQYEKTKTLFDYDRSHYCTYANVRMELKHLGELKEIWFSIRRINAHEPLIGNMDFCGWDQPDLRSFVIDTRSCIVNNKQYDNCLFMDTEDLLMTNTHGSIIDLKTVVWNKELGILQYTLKDSTIYTMKGL